MKKKKSERKSTNKNHGLFKSNEGQELNKFTF